MNSKKSGTLSEGWKNRLQAYRNPVYLVYALIGIAVFIGGFFIANSGVGPIELALFNFVNGIGDWAYRPFWLISLLGSLGAVFVVSFIALLRKHYANSIKILLAGTLAYVSAYSLKLLDIRARPDALTHEAIIREPSDGFLGYPSGHMAVATVLALTAYIYLPKKYRRLITILLILVGLSRMYLGVHFPMDLVGGWAVGMFWAGSLNFIFGSRKYRPVAPDVVKQAMRTIGYKAKSVKIANVDARGSTPYIVKFDDGSKYFLKIVGRENNLADWLFKSFRKVIYRRTEDEAPFLSAKRQLEHESYVASLAKTYNVQTPRILGIFEAQNNRWGLAQEMIDGGSLDNVDAKRITDSVLAGTWKQVSILHNARIAHRDLRASNVFLDDKNKSWLIDFGFSEASVDNSQMNRDIVELLASLTLLVGVKRSVDSSLKVFDKKRIKEALPFITYSSLSGATTTEFKKDKKLLAELRNYIIKTLKIPQPKYVESKRFNFKTLLVLISVGVAFYVLVPQIGAFEESFASAKEGDIPLLGLSVVFSIFTYLLSGLAYKILSMYPVSFIPTTIIQVASSFASKLAPAGTGGLALNARYLMKNGHSSVEAGTVAGLNNILGFVAHFSLIIAMALFTSQKIDNILPTFHLPRYFFIIAIFAVLTILISFQFFGVFRKIVHSGWKGTKKILVYYKNKPGQIIWGYIVSLLITMAYALTLYIVAKAFGADLSVLDVFYVFSIGALAASVTPTPGGIGGAEAAYVASMTSLGVEGSLALTITLAFRLVTFWLPIIPGFIAFRHAAKKDMI